jgi:hypothetical protein
VDHFHDVPPHERHALNVLVPGEANQEVCACWPAGVASTPSAPLSVPVPGPRAPRPLATPAPDHTRPRLVVLHRRQCNLLMPERAECCHLARHRRHIGRPTPTGPVDPCQSAGAAGWYSTLAARGLRQELGLELSPAVEPG